MTTIKSQAELEALYGTPARPSLVKVADRITPEYRALIEASPFAAIATVGPEGLDCSPRGDAGSLVRIRDDQTLMLPDRRGNNRIDTLRNLVRDPRCAFLFLIPGSGTTLRANGTAEISVDENLLASFAVKDQLPRSVIVFTIAELYFQCSRAVVRSDLWNPDHYVKAETVPTPGQVLAAQTAGEFDGKTYDAEWPARARESLW